MITGLFALILSFQAPLFTAKTEGDPAILGPSDSTNVIVEDRFVKIDEVLVIGNRRTKEAIILREMAIKQGHTLAFDELQGQIEIDKKNIYNTRLFNTVDATILELPDEKVDIIISVSERWYTFPNVILEPVDKNIKEWWVNYRKDVSRINYGMRLDQKNVRGRNETLKITAQLGFTKKLGLDYSFPYLDKKQKHGLSLRGSYSEENSIAYRTVNHRKTSNDQIKLDKSIFSATNAGASYIYRNSLYDYHGINFEYWMRAMTEDTIRQANPEYFADSARRQEFLSLSYGYSWKKMDVSAYPLKGTAIEGVVRKVGFGIFDHLDFWIFTASLTKYFDLGKGFYLSNYLMGYANTTKKISYNSYYGLGFGRNQVRGFEIYKIEGPAFLLNKMTFKKQLFSISTKVRNMPLTQFNHFPLAAYLKTYFDAGYVRNYKEYKTIGQNTYFSDKIVYGTGVGLDLHTLYDIVIRSEFSYNFHDKPGFTIFFGKEF